MLSVAPLITISVAASIRDRAYDIKQPARSTTCSWISIAAVDFDSIASAVLVTGSLASHEVHVVSRRFGARRLATRTPIEEKVITMSTGGCVCVCVCARARQISARFCNVDTQGRHHLQDIGTCRPCAACRRSPELGSQVYFRLRECKKVAWPELAQRGPAGRQCRKRSNTLVGRLGGDDDRQPRASSQRIPKE